MQGQHQPGGCKPSPAHRGHPVTHGMARDGQSRVAATHTGPLSPPFRPQLSLSSRREPWEGQRIKAALQVLWVHKHTENTHLPVCTGIARAGLLPSKGAFRRAGKRESQKRGKKRKMPNLEQRRRILFERNVQMHKARRRRGCPASGITNPRFHSQQITPLPAKRWGFLRQKSSDPGCLSSPKLYLPSGLFLKPRGLP